MADDKLIPNPWQALRRFTPARIALGRTGVSQGTATQLEFQLAHARARDAVHLALDAPRLKQSLEAALQAPPVSCVLLHSAANDRSVYLQRPDLGRRLEAPSRDALLHLRENDAVPDLAPFDLAIVIADGLSALAIEQNALPFLQALQARIAPERWSLAPIAIVEQGRVAIGDEVGELLGAQAVVVLIGERPGLSSPDSMGLYMTWQPRVGLTDESRNCISNVRPAGLPYPEAAVRLHYLLTQARARRLSGVRLKDETTDDGSLADEGGQRFLL
jgi:ethanolamine ammonia-lyase small subunit